MDKRVKQIIEWLKANGKEGMDGDNYSYSCGGDDDEDQSSPFMPMAIEWQHWDASWGDEGWPEHELLFVGYYTVVEGDVAHDPQYLIKIEGNTVVSVVWHNSWLGVARHLAHFEDVYGFCELIFDRHLDGVTKMKAGER